MRRELSDSGWRIERQETHLDPILQLDLATGVHRDMFKGFACTIIRFSAALKGLYYGRLVYAPGNICMKSADAA